MKLLTVRRALALTAGIAALAMLTLFAGGGEKSSEANSYNGTAALNNNASHELCQAAAPPIGTTSDHNACADNVTNGATPGQRARSEFDDGSVLPNPASLSYISGLINTPLATCPPTPVGGPGGPGCGTQVGEVTSDVDLLCDGDLDQLATSPLDAQFQPSLPIVRRALPHPGSYAINSYTENQITSILLSGTIPVALANAVTLGFYGYIPSWAGVDPNTYGTLVILGGDATPPAVPLCIQNPQRATTNFPGGGAYNAFQNPTNTAVVFWDLLTGVRDPYDGLLAMGPTGGTNERSGTALGATRVLRNVQCVAVGTSTCPAENATEATAACDDGGLWEDTDDDGLPDLVEARWGSVCNDPDSDNDGLNDFEEMAQMTNPLNADTDGDGATGNRFDSSDNCPNVENNAAPNSDNDGNVLPASDANQADTDLDGIGNACDPDDDQDGIVDDAETAGLYMAYLNDPNSAPGSQPNANCRPHAELNGSNYGGFTSATIEIITDPLDADSDDDGIVDGAECTLGSAPDDDSGGAAGVQMVCIGTSNNIGAACTSGGAIGPVGTVATMTSNTGSTGADLKPELEDTAGDDDDGDGQSNEEDDADLDGLNLYVELGERTRCARVATGGYSKGPFTPCDSGAWPGVFNNDFDGDGGALLGTVDQDKNSDCNAAWVAPNACTGAQVCVWSATAGYTADTFSTGASGGAGCDGPEYFAGNGPAMTNEDGDGLANVKSTATGAGGSEDVQTFGGAGADGGCTTGEEATFTPPGNPDNTRDFPDVNNSGKVDAVDIGLVRGAFNATAGASALFKRSLDVNAAAATGGRGSGKVDAVDIGVVRGAFNDNCQTDP